jgi:DNA-binding transcriptional LysR family regulator
MGQIDQADLAEPTELRVAAVDRIELKHLEHVVEICRSGSFSEAARRLGLTQPALSKSVSRLEAQLGIRLFERSGGAAKATELGQLVAERGRELLATSNALRRELEQRAGGASGRLRIGVGPATRIKPLPEVIQGLLTRFPDLSIEARLDNGLKIMRGVDQGRYDVAFGYSENAEPYGDLIRIKLFDDPMVVVARPGHPATEASLPLSAAQLLQYPLASVGVTARFGKWIAGVGEAETTNATALVSDDLELMQLHLPNTYTMRGPRFAFSRALAAGELVEVPLEWDSIYHCWMLTTPENWRLPVVKAVADIARSASLDDCAK